MMDILEALWYGRVCPISQTDHRDDEYQNLVELLERNERKLLSVCNQEQQDDLQKMKELWEEMERISECRAFAKGFCLAAQLMVACSCDFGK